jgi:hypothetical protein
MAGSRPAVRVGDGFVVVSRRQSARTDARPPAWLPTIPGRTWPGLPLPSPLAIGSPLITRHSSLFNVLGLWVLDFELSIPPRARQLLHQPLSIARPFVHPCIPRLLVRSGGIARSGRFVPPPDAPLGGGDGAARHPYHSQLRDAALRWQRAGIPSLAPGGRAWHIRR